MFGQEESGKFRFFHVISGYVWLYQVMSREFKICQVRPD